MHARVCGLCLGIESSCDETGLALVHEGKLVGHVLASQSDLHALFGGVVPELASREHYRFIGTLFDELLRRTGCSPWDIATVAVSRGPGLLGSLLVGVAFAKSLVLGLNARFIGVNHLHAHLLSAGLDNQLSFPALGLLISGGHTNIYRIDSPVRFTQLGLTLDDACGEAYDKIGTLLGMQYPAGRMLDLAAQCGEPTISLPMPYVDNDSLNFSFSGIKTAVATVIEKNYPQPTWERPVTDVRKLPQSVHDLCASFNHVIAKTLACKLERAIAQNPGIRTCVVSGGVAANSCVRSVLLDLSAQYKTKLLMPAKELCTDNGAMIAYAGWLLAEEGVHHTLAMETYPRGHIIPDDYVYDAAVDRGACPS
ncbi:MAG: tRNA (adenosine(37)-N6)-threonylcarbamoyltransferase complex transferase subunit TsaD [Desulfovibrionaceae bacterium]|nr:tRNA (adenosine(37)-N6)-threonylcarbamoyltransferase complex transferase subunit TsaD [Desulfovibrionaceae bacterium]